VSLDAGIVGTYAYVDTGTFRPSATAGAITNFLRPGVDGRFEMELALSRSFLIDLGATSAYYVPEELGGPMFSVGSHRDQSLWRIEQAYLVFNYRFLEHVNL
jgi:hypothetical protein